MANNHFEIQFAFITFTYENWLWVWLEKKLPFDQTFDKQSVSHDEIALGQIEYQLSSNLTVPTFKNFPYWGSIPPDLLEVCSILTCFPSLSF